MSPLSEARPIGLGRSGWSLSTAAGAVVKLSTLRGSAGAAPPLSWLHFLPDMCSQRSEATRYPRHPPLHELGHG